MRHLLWALALVLAVPAQAAVTYHWQTLDPAGTANPLVGRLAVTDEAWLAGGFDYEWRYSDCDYADNCTSPEQERRVDPDAPVLEFMFAAGNVHTYVNYREGVVGGEDMAGSRFALTFGESLSGWLYAGGGDTYISMGGDGVWAIERFSYDIGGGDDFENPRTFCGGDNIYCVGVTGRWVLDQSTVPVPLPGTLALLAFPLAFAALRRTRPVPLARNT